MNIVLFELAIRGETTITPNILLAEGKAVDISPADANAIDYAIIIDDFMIMFR